MKTKAKLVLALSVLTAGTAVAGATGTFAWFTTNRSATLVYSNVTAKNNHGTLDVVLNNLSDKAAEASTDPEDPSKKILTGKTASSTTDISSADGATLVKPIWTKTAGKGQPIEKTVAAEYGKDYVVYSFGLRNKGTSALNVFLDKGTGVTATTAAKTEDVALAKYTRVAVNDANTTTLPAETDGKYTVTPKNTIMFETSDGANTGYLAAGSKAANATNLPANSADYWHIAKEFDAVDSTASDTHGQWLITLPGTPDSDAYHYFTVTVWLEGTEADGEPFDACAGGSIDVNLQFVAYDA